MSQQEVEGVDGRKLLECPEMNMKEVVSAVSRLAEGAENPEVKVLAGLTRDMLFHILHLEGEIDDVNGDVEHLLTRLPERLG